MKRILFHFVSRGSMRMKRRDCIIIVSGIIRQRKDVIRSRIRLDWQVVIQLCMDMFVIQILNWIYWDFLKFGEIYVLTKLYLMVYQLNYQEEI